jgi:hypothetical protein
VSKEALAAELQEQFQRHDDQTISFPACVRVAVDLLERYDVQPRKPCAKERRDARRQE